MGQYIDIPTGPLHWVDYGGVGPTIVLVHGLGGSAANWDAVGPRFAGLGRTVAPDLPGFGLSPPHGSWGMSAMAHAVERFIEAVADHEVVLVGNSMGGLICEMIAASRPDLVAGLLLVSPATPPRLGDSRIHWPTLRRLAAQATPGLGTLISYYRWARYPPSELVRESLRWIAHKPGRIPLHVREALAAQVAARSKLPWSVDSVPGTARSIAAQWLRRPEFVATIREINTATLVVQGLEDRLVSPGAVEWLCRLRPDWELIQMEDTGHTPQLDAPLRFFETVTPWLEKRLVRSA